MLTGNPFLDLVLAGAIGALVAMTGAVTLCRYGKSREEELERRLVQILTVAQLRKPGALDEVAQVAREGLL